jgi:hypothetical protein
MKTSNKPLINKEDMITFHCLHTVLTLMREYKTATEICDNFSRDCKEPSRTYDLQIFPYFFVLLENSFNYIKYELKRPEEAKKVIAFFKQYVLEFSAPDLIIIEIVMPDGITVPWLFPDSIVEFNTLFSIHLRSKLPLKLITEILKTKAAKKMLAFNQDTISFSQRIMTNAFEYLSIDYDNANDVINLLSSHGLGVPVDAIKINPKKSKELIRNFPGQYFLENNTSEMIFNLIKYSEDVSELLNFFLSIPQKEIIIKIFEVFGLFSMLFYNISSSDHLPMEKVSAVIDEVIKNSLHVFNCYDFESIKYDRITDPNKRKHVVQILISMSNTIALNSTDINPGEFFQLFLNMSQFKVSLDQIKKMFNFLNEKPQFWRNSFYDSSSEFYSNSEIFGKESDYAISLLEMWMEQASLDHDLVKLQKIFEKQDSQSEKILGKMTHNLLLQIHKTGLKHTIYIAQIFAELASISWQNASILYKVYQCYITSKSPTLRKILAGMVAAFMQYHRFIVEDKDGYVQQSLVQAAVMQNITSSYYKELYERIRVELQELIISDVINLITGYLEPLFFTPPLLTEKISYKLKVPLQDLKYNDDCGAYAFVNALSSVPFVNGNLTSLNWWEKKSEEISNYFPVDEKTNYATLFSMVRGQIIEKAAEVVQGNYDTTPIIMNELIKKNSVHLKPIRDFHGIDPTMVPITMLNNQAHIGIFDASMQLQMLRNIIHIFDRIQQGKPMRGYPFLIFTQDHWFTALCFGQIFLVGDSFPNNPVDLSILCEPIQKAITRAEELKKLCKNILARAYEEFFFKNELIKSPELAAEQITQLFQMWLLITQHKSLHSVLEEKDMYKFKRAADLSEALKESKITDLTITHEDLISNLSKYSLFSQEKVSQLSKSIFCTSPSA